MDLPLFPLIKKKSFVDITPSICLLNEHFDWLFLSLQVLRLTDFYLPHTWVLLIASRILELISWLFFVHKCEWFIWWTSNSWCSAYARLRTQVSVCLYQLKIPKIDLDHHSEMHIETKVCLSSLLLWKRSPEEARLTPECFSLLLEGDVFRSLICLSHCSLYNCLLWFPGRPLW